MKAKKPNFNPTIGNHYYYKEICALLYLDCNSKESPTKNISIKFAKKEICDRYEIDFNDEHNYSLQTILKLKKYNLLLKSKLIELINGTN